MSAPPMGAERPDQGADARGDAAVCDHPSASMLDGRCRCIVCARCGKHTGNANQGHCWGFCKVTRTVRPAHFCCPDDCELSTPEGVDAVLANREEVLRAVIVRHKGEMDRLTTERDAAQAGLASYSAAAQRITDGWREITEAVDAYAESHEHGGELPDVVRSLVADVDRLRYTLLPAVHEERDAARAELAGMRQRVEAAREFARARAAEAMYSSPWAGLLRILDGDAVNTLSSDDPPESGGSCPDGVTECVHDCDPQGPCRAPHAYTSTACLHAQRGDQPDGHTYCASDTGKSGSKSPAKCKWCDARCACPCHPWNGHAHV